MDGRRCGASLAASNHHSSRSLSFSLAVHYPRSNSRYRCSLVVCCIECNCAKTPRLFNRLWSRCAIHSWNRLCASNIRCKSRPCTNQWWNHPRLRCDCRVWQQQRLSLPPPHKRSPVIPVPSYTRQPRMERLSQHRSVHGGRLVGSFNEKGSWRCTRDCPPYTQVLSPKWPSGSCHLNNTANGWVDSLLLTVPSLRLSLPLRLDWGLD